MRTARAWWRGVILGVLALVLAGVLVVGCGGDNGDADSDTRAASTTSRPTTTPSTAVPTGRWDDTEAALCTAAAAAAAGDGDGVRAAFLDQAHDQLHELARESATTDRTASASLLIAKEQVESTLEGDTSVLAGNLPTLIEATRAAIAVTGEPVPRTC